MFQPRSSDSPGSKRPLIIGGAVVVVAVLAVIIFLVVRSHNSSGGGGTPTPAPGVQLKGSFSKTTMTCPGQKEIAGDTCIITVHLDGKARITVAWTGDALLAMGVRDSAGKDLGPQVTGEKGQAVFDTGTVKAGDYALRVVDVTHPAQPFDFTVTITPA